MIVIQQRRGKNRFDSMSPLTKGLTISGIKSDFSVLALVSFLKIISCAVNYVKLVFVFSPQMSEALHIIIPVSLCLFNKLSRKIKNILPQSCH